MTHVQDDPLIEQLPHCSNLPSVLGCLLTTSLILTGAPLGNVQLMDWTTGHLIITGQCGFNSEFLSFFRRVTAGDGSACGRVLKMRRAIVIEDVLLDPQFAACREIALRAGFRAVQSTPLISSSGAFVGVLSTHFPAPHRPLDQEMSAVNTAALLTANAVIYHRSNATASDAHSERIRKSRAAIAHSQELLRLAKSRAW